MVIKFVTFCSVMVLFVLAAIIGFTGGGQGVGNLLAGMIGLPVLSALSNRFAAVH